MDCGGLGAEPGSLWLEVTLIHSGGFQSREAAAGIWKGGRVAAPISFTGEADPCLSISWVLSPAHGSHGAHLSFPWASGKGQAFEISLGSKGATYRRRLLIK